MQLIDLTQSLSPNIPDWNGCCGFKMETVFDYEKDHIRVQEINTPLGIGTHIDAPSHFYRNSLDIASLALDNFFVEAVLIDVSEKISPDYLLSIDDIKKFEDHHGSIPYNSFIIAKTGWCKFLNNPKQYRNINSKGIMSFPGYSPEAIDYLLLKNIVGIGIDTLSPDGGNIDFPVHKKILSANKYIVENLCNLDVLPVNKFRIIILPIKIAGGTEAPCRVVAMID